MRLAHPWRQDRVVGDEVRLAHLLGLDVHHHATRPGRKAACIEADILDRHARAEAHQQVGVLEREVGAALAGGAEAALLQQAALAFLSGEGDGSSGGGIAQKLGLDEIGFKGPGQGEGANGAALTFGKRLSRDLYVTYEKSLSGALGTLYIFYDLTRRLTLRGQTGQQSAVDLIYTVRYD